MSEVQGVIRPKTPAPSQTPHLTPVYEEGNGWVVPAGWIANGAGGWTSPNGARHWGARERPPLKLANDSKSGRSSELCRSVRSAYAVQTPTSTGRMHPL
jgi:hypothetical protein